MSLKSIIALVAGGLAVYYYKKGFEEQYEALQKKNQENNQYFLDEMAKLQNKINPNGSADQAPLAITGTVRFVRSVHSLPQKRPPGSQAAPLVLCPPWSA